MMKIVFRTLRFLILGLAAYLLGALLLSLIQIGDTSAMKIATRNPVQPGGFGFALQRFQDIENYGDVDILFLGSSHCYRTHDPRIYAEEGYSSFNLGTTGQTPLNSYFLLRAYFEQLDPELVVLDLNYHVIDRDGLESFYDLVVNMPYRRELWPMAFAINSPHAINGVVSKWLLHLSGREPDLRQEAQDGEAYIPRGYVEFSSYLENGATDYYEAVDEAYYDAITPADITPAAVQLYYLEKLIEFVQRKNKKIVLLTKPEARENLQLIANYDEVAGAFADIARKHGVLFLDFNRIDLPLDSNRHFHDKEYLNPFGVRIFIPEFIRRLRAEGMLPPAGKTVSNMDREQP